jgi:hypothetical protein
MKWLFAAFIILTCLLLAAWAVAADPQARLSQVAGNHQKYAKPGPKTRTSDPTDHGACSLLLEIRAVMDSTRIAEMALREAFGSGQDQELARRLGDLEKASRMRILHIQLKYAREEGRTELERRILTSIEDLQRPAAPGGPRLSGRISPTSVAKRP